MSNFQRFLKGTMLALDSSTTPTLGNLTSSLRELSAYGVQLILRDEFDKQELVRLVPTLSALRLRCLVQGEPINVQYEEDEMPYDRSPLYMQLNKILQHRGVKDVRLDHDLIHTAEEGCWIAVLWSAMRCQKPQQTQNAQFLSLYQLELKSAGPKSYLKLVGVYPHKLEERAPLWIHDQNMLSILST